MPSCAAVPSNAFVSADGSPIDDLPGYSGISLANRWLLAHGSLLAPRLRSSAGFLRFVSDLRAGPPSVVEGSNRATFRVHRDGSPIESARLAAIWKCPLLAETLSDGSFESWSFGERRPLDRLLLPLFLLIERAPGSRAPDRTEIGRVLARLAKQAAARRVAKGDPIELISTPFGNALFADSLARGIVANSLGAEDCLLLLDATAFPGSEGGPVYAIDHRGQKSICGMVIASLVRCRGEWIGCAFAVNLLPSLNAILGRPMLGDAATGIRSLGVRWNRSRPTSVLEESVAIVICGPNWGTCILLDEPTGTFLTCAHVVAEAPERRIRVVKRAASGDGETEWSAEASLIYRATENRPYDVAVLRIESISEIPRSIAIAPIEFADAPASPGERILSIGYPFSSHHRPTITSGIVSKTSDCMFQTSCCVQSGVSGGPVLRRTTFEMLGVIVCNVAASSGSIFYPRLSIAIPVAALKGPLTDYLRTGDAKTLERLARSDVDAANAWNLRPFLSSNM